LVGEAAGLRRDSRPGAMGERTAILSPLARGVFSLALIVFGCNSESSQPGSSSGSSQTNRPPTVQSATIMPNPVVRSGPITVQVEAIDPDRDAVTFRNRWLVNGNPIDGQTGLTLEPQLFKRGDSVAVEEVPSDGKTH